MNILYFGNPQSIHDIKWASYFASQKDCTVYFIGEKIHENDINTTKDTLLSNHNIHLLIPIDSFSISNPLQTLRAGKTIQWYIDDLKIDVFHVLFAAPFALWTLFVSTPTIITTRGSDILIEIPKLKKAGLKGRFFFHLFKKAFLKSAITGTSEKQVVATKELFAKTATVVRTGVDVTRINGIATKNSNSRNLIFSPRYFQPIYNILLQLDSIELLPKETVDNYTFVFIEGNSADEKYSEQVKARLLKLKQKVGLSYEIYKSLGQEQMFELYGKSALTIMTPLSDGTPNSALEAMASKCPLIVSDLSYDKSLFNNTCLILKDSTPNGLKELMLRALNNYPPTLLETAFSQVLKNGNRATEMEKINQMYKRISGE